MLEITVNGRRHMVDTTPDTPLLTVLRNDLRLNAAKFGCGLGKCGSCTVLVEGLPALSCQVTLGEIGDAEVTTLEGLGPPDVLHPLQQAFLDEQAAQCGYCIPGIVMRAAALLAEQPDPDDATVRAALAANLCRCGSHVRILRAVHRAAAAMRAEATPQVLPQVMP